MTRCTVRACPHFKKRAGVDDSGLKCHRFPDDEQLRQKWIDFVNRANIAGVTKASKQAGVCSAHFTPEDFIPNNNKLKNDAIPTIAPEMTPEMAFKLGVARSAEDFIRSRQMKQSDTVLVKEESYLSVIPDPESWFQANNSEHESQPVVADASPSHILVQAYSQYSPEPESDYKAPDTSTNISVKRIFVVPIVNLREGTGRDSSTDSCFSDQGETNHGVSKLPPPLRRIPVSSTGSSRISRVDEFLASQTIPRIDAATCGVTTVSSETNSTNASPGTTFETIIIDATGTGAQGANLVMERTPVTSSTHEEGTGIGASASTGCIDIIPTSQRPKTPPRRYKRKLYLRDLSPSDFSTPEKAKRSLSHVHKKVSIYQARLKQMAQKLRRAQKKIGDLTSLLEDKKNS